MTRALPLFGAREAAPRIRPGEQRIQDVTRLSAYADFGEMDQDGIFDHFAVCLSGYRFPRRGKKRK